MKNCTATTFHAAQTLSFAGPEQLFMSRKTIQEPDLHELQGNIGDVDIVLYEGFKSSAINKIEVFRHGVSGNRPLCMDDPSFIALVTDIKFDVAIPQFDLNDAVGVATLIGERE